jgi:protein TonB
MSIRELPPPPAGTDERLTTTLAFAVLLHATVILGVRFAPSALPGSLASTIEVTLVSESGASAPRDAAYLAQAASAGSGNTTDKVRPQAPLATAAPLDLPGLEAGDEWLNATPGSASTEAPDSLDAPDPRQRLLHRAVTTSRARRELASAARPVSGVEAPRLVVSHLMTRTADATDPVNQVNQRALAHSPDPRERFVAVNAAESRYAAYLEQWRQRVERVGNAEYPALARANRLSGRLVLEIVLNADGTIRELATRRSSRQAVLDEAAYRAVRHAAPFPPFPREVRAETDVLRFLYEWRYESGTVTATMRGMQGG